LNKKTKIAWCCIATFFSLCLVVIVINVFDMKEGVLENIDALTHFFGGTFVAIIVLAAFLPFISKPTNKIRLKYGHGKQDVPRELCLKKQTETESQIYFLAWRDLFHSRL
jgi:hypothetical protein